MISTLDRFVILAGVCAVVVTLVVCVSIIRLTPGPPVPTSLSLAAAPATPRPGVEAEITAGDVTVTRSLPSLSLRLNARQTLDGRLPAGPFEGRITVTFYPGSTRYARLGAWIEGGSLIIRRNDRVLVSEFADEPRMVLTREPESLGSRAQSLVYEFKAAADSASTIRAMWQPEGSAVPLPLPADGAALDDDPALAGALVLERYGCARCHRSESDTRQERLLVSEPPLLDDVASRARVEWIRDWLAGPRDLKPTARMPEMFHDAPEDAERIEDLVHFLASLGEPIAGDGPIARAEVDTGRRLYHEIGCVACHGPLQGVDGGATPEMFGRYDALGAVSRKTSVAALAEYLEDPLAVHPGGLMPSMLLNGDEARRIAAYLVDFDRIATGGPDTPGEPAFVVEPQRAARGRVGFAELGCASCHELESQMAAPAAAATPLERLLEALPDGGCIGSSPRTGQPHFDLSAGERDDLEAFLASLPDRRSDDVPHDDLARTLLRLNCTACHPFHGQGGPEAAIRGYFGTIGEADLGDEGRLPPMLSDAGARLHPQWIGQVLAAGARARPYLATRMPVFAGRDVARLPADLCVVAGVPPVAGEGPPFDLAHAAAGRVLVGATAMNCIQCHDIAGRRGTGTPGPDLATMVERLRYEGFARWLHDPALVRPGTRMPSFFVNGRSGFVEHFDGAAEEQIRAVWCYLSQGEMLPLPEGIVDPAGLALEVTDEPIVFRTFMAAAGVRAIACGFPEQVHCAFDADRCELAAIWVGSFLNASGAWAARGGSETNPETLRWTAGDEPVLRSPSPETPARRRFRGYRLDESRRPVLTYELTIGVQTIEVLERPRPHRDNEHAAMRRRIELRGPVGAALLVAPGRFSMTRGEGVFEELLGGELEKVTLDETGRASLELELRW